MLLIFAYILYVISKTDLETRQIPDECSLAICILAIGKGGFSLNELIAALFFMLFTSVFMGLGDAKLLASLRLFLGAKTAYVLVFSFILAGFYCLAGLISKRLKLKDSIAFAPFISIFALYFSIENALALLAHQSF